MEPAISRREHLVKPQPNRALYIQILRQMTPEQRLEKAFELTEFSRSLFRQGLRNRNPEASEEEIHQLYLAGLRRCSRKS